jgi:transcriptional regulator with XRE-family HTH domain
MTAQSVDEAALSLAVEDARDALARNLAAARSALGWSQEDLAHAAGVSRATVNQLEGGASAKSDPRLSTVAGLATALGISPMLLLLDREELDAINEIPKSQEAESVSSQLNAEQLETMRRLLRSGVAKNRAEAVAMGTTAATLAGISAGPLAAAAIGTAILPGIGTAVGAAIAAAWISKKNIVR